VAPSACCHHLIAVLDSSGVAFVIHDIHGVTPACSWW
jgi:hypothetical protein